MGNNDENLFDDESIFQSAKDFSDNYTAKPVVNPNPQGNGLMSKLISSISNKISEYEDKIENEKYKRQLTKMFEKDADIFEILSKFGCKIKCINATYLEIKSEPLNLIGHINLAAQKEEEIFDENAKRIMRNIAYVTYNKNQLEDIIDVMESEGFYPVGALEIVEAILSGEKCEVHVGKFQNENGEERTIYFYNGQQVFPQEPDSENEN